LAVSKIGWGAWEKFQDSPRGDMRSNKGKAVMTPGRLKKSTGGDEVAQGTGRGKVKWLKRFKDRKKN